MAIDQDAINHNAQILGGQLFYAVLNHPPGTEEVAALHNAEGLRQMCCGMVFAAATHYATEVLDSMSPEDAARIGDVALWYETQAEKFIIELTTYLRKVNAVAFTPAQAQGITPRRKP